MAGISLGENLNGRYICVTTYGLEKFVTTDLVFRLIPDITF